MSFRLALWYLLCAAPLLPGVWAWLPEQTAPDRACARLAVLGAPLLLVAPRGANRRVFALQAWLLWIPVHVGACLLAERSEALATSSCLVGAWLFATGGSCAGSAAAATPTALGLWIGVPLLVELFLPSAPSGWVRLSPWEAVVAVDPLSTAWPFLLLCGLWTVALEDRPRLRPAHEVRA